MKLRPALTALTLAGALIAPATAGAATRTHMTPREHYVVQQARTIYGLPATHATCWHTGPTTYSCWVSGPHTFRAIATGTAKGVDFA